MTFFEHVDALRPHLMRGGIAIFVLVIAAFCLGDVIFGILFGPMMPDFVTNRFFHFCGEKLGIAVLSRINDEPIYLVNTVLAGQFQLHIKASIITAIVLGVPYILWEVWQFVRPALTVRELKATNKFVFFVSLCFFTGLMFGYFVIAPLSVNFLASYEASSAIHNMTNTDSLISAIINVSLACGAVFQLPLLVYFLSRMGILTPGFMRKYRRHSIIILAIFSAIITPPDLFSLILVILPLYGLYELSINLSAGVHKRMAEEEA